MFDGQAVPFQDLSAPGDAGSIGGTIGGDDDGYHAAIVQADDGQAIPAGGLLVEKLVADLTEGHADMAIGDGPGEIAQGQEVGSLVALFFGFLDTGGELDVEGVPIETFQFGEWVFLGNLLVQRIEGFGPTHLGVIIDGEFALV